MQEPLLAVTQVQVGQEVIQVLELQVVTPVEHQEVIQVLVLLQVDQAVTQGLALLQVVQEVILLAPEDIPAPSLL